MIIAQLMAMKILAVQFIDASDETFRIRGGRGCSRSGMLHRTKGKAFRYPKYE